MMGVRRGAGLEEEREREKVHWNQYLTDALYTSNC